LPKALFQVIKAGKRRDLDHGLSAAGARMLADLLRDCKVALAFLTRLPLSEGRSWSGADLATSAPLFPLVGTLVGLAGGLAYACALWLGLPPLPAAAIALAATAWLTGALHEDGLADVADGLGGGRTPEAKLAIMRDPRIGSYGALALMLALLGRAGALAALAEPGVVLVALVAAGAISRAALPAVMAALPQARADGLAAQAGRPHPLRAAAAALIAALIALALLGSAAPAALVAGALGALAVALLAWRQIGGYTGDVLGAIQQLSEIGVLFGVIMVRAS
jgi:adenosylcobinamide-GDP ribazoletransferase